MGPRSLRLTCAGPLADDTRDAFVASLSSAVTLPCRLEPREYARPQLVPGRDQWDARAFLAWTAGLAYAAHDEIVLGLTSEDLGLPVFTFVFGLAHPGRAAVISLARLDPCFYGLGADPARMHARAVGEALHELGHVAGRYHCPQPACLMRFAASVAAADARGSAFCEACQRQLPSWLKAGSPLARGAI